MRDDRLPDFPVAVPIEVSFADLDAMGHVNNAVYLSYLEWARTKYWLALNRSIDFHEIGFVVARIEIDYVSSAEMCETLLVGVRIPEIGRKSFVFEYRIVAPAREDGSEMRLVARARSVQVRYDWRTKQTLPIDDALRTHIEQVERGQPS
jgi:acyl-CoA thioester hydrolase